MHPSLSQRQLSIGILLSIDHIIVIYMVGALALASLVGALI